MGSKCFKRNYTIRKKDDAANGYGFENSNRSGIAKRRAVYISAEILALIKWHNISKDFVLNFEQTSVSYTVRNSTLEFEGAKSIPVKGKVKGKQITETFTVTDIGHY